MKEGIEEGMHHKRHRPKSKRAGCLFCKPHKDERVKNTLNAQVWQERRARVSEREQREEPQGS